MGLNLRFIESILTKIIQLRIHELVKQLQSICIKNDMYIFSMEMGRKIPLDSIDNPFVNHPQHICFTSQQFLTLNAAPFDHYRAALFLLDTTYTCPLHHINCLRKWNPKRKKSL